MDLLALVRWRELIDVLDRMLGKCADTLWIASQGRAIMHVPRDAALSHDASDRTDRVGTPAEADQKDAIPFLVKTDDGGIAIDDVARDPEARRHAGEVIERAHPADLKMPAVPRRAESRIVECDLIGRFYLRIVANTAGSVELVNIGPRFVEIDAAGLSSAVGKNYNALRHCTPLPESAPNADLCHIL